jgi:hypothetical protein
MRLIPLACVVLPAVWLVTGMTAAQTPAPSPTADQLIAKVIAARPERGFVIRATLTRTTTGSERRDVRQLLIKGRRELAGSIVLYQQLWPVVPKGLAVVIEDSGNHRLAGFQHEAGRVTPLSNDMLGKRFFDSDLILEDLAEHFWFWPIRSIGGAEDIGKYTTTMVSLRPGSSASSSYSLVRTWLAPEQALGLRTKLYGRGGALAKTINLYGILKFGNRWAASIVTIEPTDRPSRTVIEGVKGERDILVAKAEFTPAAVRKALSLPVP